MNERRSVKSSGTPNKGRSGRKPSFQGNEAHLQILKESLRRRTPHFWNMWREQHPRVTPDLRGLILAGGFLRGFNLMRARLDKAILTRADLAGVHLERASLKEADLISAELSSVHAEKVNLSGANCRDATLRQGDFREAVCLGYNTYLAHANLSEANFTRAKMIEATLTQANLTRTRFDEADLTGVILSDAILDETSFLGTNLQGAHVYGTFIRRVKTDEKTNQHGLSVDVHVAWEKRSGDIIKFTEANDIRVAQFHNIVDEPGSVGKLLAATKRVVLILGRFLPQRKRVLNRLAAALRDRGKIAVIFDFPSPEDREVSDTVRFIAGMSEFIVVDLTKASSVPLELQAAIPDLMIPVLPIIQSGQDVFSMFSDLQRRYFWIQPTVSYENADQLVEYVDDAIIARAESAAEQINKRRAVSVSAPVSVA